MTTDTAEETLVAAKKATNELTVGEAREQKAKNHAMNFALIGGDSFHGYESDFVSRALTERNHPMFKAFKLN